VVTRETTFSLTANVLMDNTYFGRIFGVMVFKDSHSCQILLKKYVKYEPNKSYFSGIEEIVRRGITIQLIISDARKGLLQLFGNIPVQMYNFHQVAIIRQDLTKKPKMQASVELWKHVLLMRMTDKESSEGELADWFNKWEVFLNERKLDSKREE